MRVMDIHMYGIDLVSASSGVYLPTRHRPRLKFHGVGGLSVTTQSDLVFLQGKVNDAPTLHNLLIPCYCHLFDRKEMYFFRRTVHIHIWLL